MSNVAFSDSPFFDASKYEEHAPPPGGFTRDPMSTPPGRVIYRRDFRTGIVWLLVTYSDLDRWHETDSIVNEMCGEVHWDLAMRSRVITRLERLVRDGELRIRETFDRRYYQMTELAFKRQAEYEASHPELG